MGMENNIFSKMKRILISEEINGTLKMRMKNNCCGV